MSNRIPLQPVRVDGNRVLASQRALVAKLASRKSDAGYEATLAKVGLHTIQDQVPDLMPYFRGFQLLDMSDDGDYAAGFFVFETSGQIVDIPIFMIDGKIKGKELAFLRDRQLFVPAHDELIRYLLSMKQSLLGEDAGKNEMSSNRALPNIDVFSRANRFLTRKVSSYPHFASQWGREAGVFESALSIQIADETVDVLGRFVKRASLCDTPLEGILPLPGVAEKLAAWCHISPKLAKRVEKRLGKDWVRKVAEVRYEYQQKLKRPDPGKLKLAVSPEFKLDIARREAEAFPIGVSSRVPKFASLEVRDRAASEIARFGAYFVDRRDKSQVKLAMEIDEMTINRGFSGPTVSGEYRVPLTDRETTEAIVLLFDRLVCGGYGRRGESIVIEKGTNRASFVPTTDLLVVDGSWPKKVDAEDSWVADLPEVGGNMPGKGACFVLIDGYRRIAGPFCASSDVNENAMEVHSAYVKTCGTSPRNQDGYSMTGDSGDSGRFVPSASRIMFVDKGSGFEVVPEEDDGQSYSSVLLVPKTAKIIRLKQQPDDGGSSVISADSGYVKPLPVLTLSRMTEDFKPKVANFSVTRVSDDIVLLNGKEVPVGEAIYSMMSRYDLPKDQAIKIASDPSTNRRRYVVLKSPDFKLEPWQVNTEYARKVAAPPYTPFPGGIYPPDQPPYSFMVPEMDRGTSDSVIPVPEEYPTVGVDRQPMEYADQSSPEWSGYEAPYEQPFESQVDIRQETNVAQDLANSPENMWENKTFLALISNVRTDRAVMLVTATSLKLADAAGRMLFLMYAHPEEFESTLGDKDYTEIEEQLLSLMESAGEMAFSLMKRAVDVGGEGVLQMVESAS
ncbi:MAG: hypothetical protein KatS3mg109_0070 [Pirellulaceae bacterium]|nr:MAG: hypothetical protein KatS3mg109_0070 [Pirellulaceae bacterium]